MPEKDKHKASAPFSMENFEISLPVLTNMYIYSTYTAIFVLYDIFV